jgi:hypothetical protein
MEHFGGDGGVGGDEGQHGSHVGVDHAAAFGNTAHGDGFSRDLDLHRRLFGH